MDKYNGVIIAVIGFMVGIAVREAFIPPLHDFPQCPHAAIAPPADGSTIIDWKPTETSLVKWTCDASGDCFVSYHRRIRQ